MAGNDIGVGGLPESNDIKRFYFSSGIFARLIGETLVILNLNEDRYLQINLSDNEILLDSLEQAFNALSRNSAFDGAIQLTGSQLREIHPQVDALIERGLLSPNPANTTASGLSEAVELTHDFNGSSCDTSKIRIAEHPAFWYAISTSDIRLKFQDLKKIVDRFKSRSDRCSPADKRAALRAWQVFSTLRPLYPRPVSCLFDSLAAATYFQICDIRVAWTFGVKLQPFEAHCWLEYGDAVVNDSVDSISRFTRIMRV